MGVWGGGGVAGGEGGLVLMDFYILVVLKSSVNGLNPYFVSQNLSLKV